MRRTIRRLELASALAELDKRGGEVAEEGALVLRVQPEVRAEARVRVQRLVRVQPQQLWLCCIPAWMRRGVSQLSMAYVCFCASAWAKSSLYYRPGAPSGFPRSFAFTAWVEKCGATPRVTPVGQRGDERRAARTEDSYQKLP